MSHRSDTGDGRAGHASYRACHRPRRRRDHWSVPSLKLHSPILHIALTATSKSILGNGSHVCRFSPVVFGVGGGQVQRRRQPVLIQACQASTYHAAGVVRSMGCSVFRFRIQRRLIHLAAENTPSSAGQEPSKDRRCCPNLVKNRPNSSQQRSKHSQWVSGTPVGS